MDDNEAVRTSLCAILERHGFAVTGSRNVNTALALIASETYDVLLSDLHMPGAGDGLTVVSAKRHANPEAVTLLLSSFPVMSAAGPESVLLNATGVSNLVGSCFQTGWRPYDGGDAVQDSPGATEVI